MPKNITLMGASFSDVPAVDLPQTGGGTARFIDPSPTTAIDSDVASGKIYYKSDGTQSVGTASAGQAIVITDETDSHGGTIRHINGVVVSGTKSITQNGAGIDVTEYAAVDVNVSTGTPRTSTDLTVSGATVTAPAGYYASAASKSVASGSATAPATISGTSATVSTGTNTLTLTKTVSVTPSVTAGYVSSGTAGNSSVSLTASVTTQGAQTIHPSTTDQTISSGRYLTGTQTIKAVTMTNLTADNIKSGVVVKIGDSTDDDCVTSITGTYSGGGGTAMNTQTTQSTSRRNNTALGSIMSLTCSTAGTYDVYWTCTRSNTSQTW